MLVRAHAINIQTLTELDVFMSILFFKCSITLSIFPDRAALKNEEVFPSAYKTIKTIASLKLPIVFPVEQSPI